jgi:hypothetical protein
VDGDTILVTRLMAGDEEALSEILDGLGLYVLAVAGRRSVGRPQFPVRIPKLRWT